MRLILFCLATLLAIHSPLSAKVHTITLAEGGSALCRVIDQGDDTTSALAVEELQHYLGAISGADFSAPESNKSRIVVRYDKRLSVEEWRIEPHRRGITLSGGGPRGLLYATYTFLEQLGCRWLAPAFEFYPEGKHEVVPHTPTLRYTAEGPTSGQPVMKYRKLYIEEGHSHTPANTVELIRWMAKLQYNTLVYPIDYQGKGRVRWDAVRDTLTPHLRQRGIVIEVGGHGYQNFLNATMEDGRLWNEHPEWFALHEGERSKEQKRVFCTSSEEATEYMTSNLLAYIEAHPEIDIFDFWPPDGARWCECEKCQAIGNDSDKHALLVGKVATRIAALRPDLKIECLGYSHYKNPSQRHTIAPNVLVDFCPINQSFEGQIYESFGSNPTYTSAMAEWKERFEGEISIYSYYRKYAWHSLPILLPHYMQKDVKWYLEQGISGISIYCEPGDWGTYEVNLYTLGKVAQNPDVDVDLLLREFAQGRYGSAWRTALATIGTLEQLARKGCSIPGTSVKSEEWYTEAIARLDFHSGEIKTAATIEGAEREALCDLGLMVEFVRRDFEIQRRRAQGASVEERRERAEELVAWLRTHLDEGVFLDAKARPALFYKQYGARR